jgi:hypothetical protein
VREVRERVDGRLELVDPPQRLLDQLARTDLAATDEPGELDRGSPQ